MPRFRLGPVDRHGKAKFPTAITFWARAVEQTPAPPVATLNPTTFPRPRRPSGGDVCAAADRHLLAKLGADLHGAPTDLVWITHQHSDHIGGAPEVLTTFHVGTYADNGRDARKAEVRRAHRRRSSAGRSFALSTRIMPTRRSRIRPT